MKIVVTGLPEDMSERTKTDVGESVMYALFTQIVPMNGVKIKFEVDRREARQQVQEKLGRHGNPYANIGSDDEG